MKFYFAFSVLALSSALAAAAGSGDDPFRPSDEVGRPGSGGNKGTRMLRGGNKESAGGDRVLNSGGCSSEEQVGMTLKSWYFGHENGGTGKWSECEAICRGDPKCNSWMGRNSGNACYLSEDKDLKQKPEGCCDDHHPYTFNAENCKERSEFCSSEEQVGMTLKSWYFGHENGGTGQWSDCEAICRNDSKCNSWMGRNSGNACYLSEDKDLKPKPEGCCDDHHPYTFNAENCKEADTTTTTTEPEGENGPDAGCDSDPMGCDTGKGEAPVATLFTEEQVKAFLDGHNSERAAVGAPPLVWDEEIAEYAQKYANHIAETGEYKHYSNEERDRLNQGENLGRSSGRGANGTIMRRIQKWSEEKINEAKGGKLVDVKGKTLDQVIADEHPWKFNDFGHYTQMVWGKSEKLGAGIAKIKTGKYEGDYVVVARYWPKGNRGSKVVVEE